MDAGEGCRAEILHPVPVDLIAATADRVARFHRFCHSCVQEFGIDVASAFAWPTTSESCGP
jgi:hypothetical protein